MKSVITKIAAGVLLASSSLVFAADLAVDDYKTASALVTLGLDEFEKQGDFGAEGNVAMIVQEGSDSIAYIDQRDTTLNFALIGQTSDGALAIIVQTGSNNRALIAQ